MDNLGKVPEINDMLVYENLTLTVTQTEFRRITQLHVTVAADNPEVQPG